MNYTVWFTLKYSATMFILLIIVTTLGTLIADDAMSDGNIQCFNDYDETMVCHFITDKSKCAEYSMTLKQLNAQNRGKNDCTFKEKERSNDVSKCGCSIDPMPLISGEEFNATLWNSGKRLNSEVFSINYTIKPKTPTIQDVKPTENGNFLVKWKTNYTDKEEFSKNLIAELSYRKKGETDEVSKNESTTSYELLGRDLEPNTIYALKDTTYTDWSGRFSDWSEELEFTNPASSRKVLQIVIAFSCIAVIVITSALFWCSVRYCLLPKYFYPPSMLILQKWTPNKKHGQTPRQEMGAAEEAEAQSLTHRLPWDMPTHVP